MLLEFKIENFLSFKDLNTFSMASMKSFKEHEDTHLIKVSENLNLLKSSVIYGNNASGKSNFVNSLSFMKNLVLNSFRDALMENFQFQIPLEKFLLNSKNEIDPSFFEVTFIENNKKFRYGFEINDSLIIAEWLFHTTTKEVPLFKREKQKILINKSSFLEGIGLESKVRENVLFLTLVAQLNGEISESIIKWFKNFNSISGIHDMFFKNYTIEKLKNDEEFKSWTKEFMKFLEISDISTTEEKNDQIDFDLLRKNPKNEQIVNLLSSVQEIQKKQPKRAQVLTWHKKYDENNLLIDTIPFNFDKRESEGTKKLIYLLGPWYDTLKNGKRLIVDELDSRLHPVLTKKLIDYFHYYNKNNAQLIFVVHDTSILNRDVFRRDQIWFVEKNQFGASEIYSLADFKTTLVRNKSAFDKNYIQGKYGAIPYFGGEERLIKLLYE
ncbi:MAG: ATP/GTP-binding protein [Bacteroidales bacterium]